MFLKWLSSTYKDVKKVIIIQIKMFLKSGYHPHTKMLKSGYHPYKDVKKVGYHPYKDV
jgi:hypothetical protein